MAVETRAEKGAIYLKSKMTSSYRNVRDKKGDRDCNEEKEREKSKERQ